MAVVAPALIIPQRFVDSNNVPLTNGKLFTYAAGTTTKQATYTDSTGTTQNTNPVILNSRGEANVWFDISLSYKIVLAPAYDTDPPGAAIWTVDNLPGAALNSAQISFTQSGTGAVQRTVQAKLQDAVSVRDFGAKGDGVTDDTNAIQTAINAVAVNGGSILFPAGFTYNYTTLTFPTASTAAIALVGYGAILNKTSTTGDGIVVQGAAGSGGPSGVKRRGCVVEGFRFTQSGTPTSGATIHVKNEEHCSIRDVIIDSPYGGIQVTDCFDVSIGTRVYIRNSISFDIKLEGTGATPTCIDTTLTDVVGEGTAGNTTKTGLIIDSGVSGLYVVNCDFAQGNYGVLTQISYTYTPEFALFSNATCDGNATHGWYIGSIHAFFYDNCWGASAGQSGFELASGTGHHLTSPQAYSCGRNGININGAAEVHINGGIVSGNSTSGANTYHGVNVLAGSSGFSIKNLRSGNIASLGSGTQGYGINVSAGASTNYQIIDNDTRGNGTGSINDGGTGTPKRVMNNLGYNPRGYLGSVSVPASTVAYTNAFGVDATTYITGGTVTLIELNAGAGWVTTGVTSGALSVPTGGQIRITYSVAPSWTWFGV